MKLEEINDAIINNKVVTHTCNGDSIKYHISGVITRYHKRKGWYYSLELISPNKCLVYARPEDVTVDD